MGGCENSGQPTGPSPSGSAHDLPGHAGLTVLKFPFMNREENFRDLPPRVKDVCICMKLFPVRGLLCKPLYSIFAEVCNQFSHSIHHKWSCR